MKIKILIMTLLTITFCSNAFSAMPKKSAKSIIPKVSKEKCDSDKCKSAAQIFGDVYQEWGAVIIATGCVVGVTAASGGVAMVATLNCIKNASKYAAAVEKMVKYFNENAGNSRWKIGPRRIDWGAVQTGTVISTASRVFISAAPIDKDSVTVKVKKVDGRAQADIIICKVDEKGTLVKLAQVEFAEGDDNIGQEITKTVTGVKGHLVQVRIDADSVVKKFEYQVKITK